MENVFLHLPMHSLQQDLFVFGEKSRWAKRFIWHFLYVNAFDSLKILVRKSYHFHFAKQEAEARRGQSNLPTVTKLLSEGGQVLTHLIPKPQSPFTSPWPQLPKCYTAPLLPFKYKIPGYKSRECFLIHNIKSSSTLENFSYNRFSVIVQNTVTLTDLHSIGFLLVNNGAPHCCQSERRCCFFSLHYVLTLHVHD